MKTSLRKKNLIRTGIPGLAMILGLVLTSQFASAEAVKVTMHAMENTVAIDNKGTKYEELVKSP